MVVLFMIENLVETTGDVIVLSFTATGAHNLYPASHLLTTALLVFTSTTRGETAIIPKKGIPKLAGLLRSYQRSLVWTGNNVPAAPSR